MELQIIHVLLGKANPNRMNGVNKVVNSLAEHQALLGSDVTVWGVTKSPVHDYPSRSYKTRLFKDTGKFSISHELKMAIELLENVKVIFHFHGGFIPQFKPIAKLLVRHKIEYVFTPHGAFNTVALQRSKYKKKVYIKLLENYLVKHAKHVHLIGQSEVAGTQKVFGEIRFELIANGQASTGANPVQVSKNGNRAPVFGFVGRLDLHTKGLDTLLSGFAQQLRRTNNSSELWLIGNGPDREKLEELAQNLDIGKQMKLLGVKYGTEKDELVKQFDFLCLVSRNEGLPGVVLEAASAGIPSIVSKETNLETYILNNNAGFVAESNTIEGVTTALMAATKCIHEKKNFQLGRNAVKMIQRDFDWFTIAKAHLFSYEAV
jgi:glycosyltransferase involved in cell wall biosynthesis